MRQPPFACRVAVAALAAIGAFGCAGGSGGGGTVHGADFPSQAELESIADSPAPARVFDAGLRYVPEWTVEAPAPERLEGRRWVAPTAWGELLGEASESAGGHAVPTEAMHCLASELARFALELGGGPDASLLGFLVAACNATGAKVSYGSLFGEVGADEADGDVFERWRDSAGELARKALAPGNRAIVGIGFARRADRAAVVVASGQPLVEVEPVGTRLAPGQAFELRGRALGAVESIEAAINRGHHGAALCEPVGRTRLPAFHFACQPDPADASAWVSLSLMPPNRVLGQRALDVLVWPRGEGARTWRRVEYTSPRPIADAAAFLPAFLDALNAVRARAGASPVALGPAQSETATRVAPHFFAALTGDGDERVADLAALGLLAGWDVEGTIRTGGFAAAVVPETSDLSVLLAALLEDPLGRLALLDPHIEQVAVGPIVGEVGETSALAAVVTAYSFFRDGTQSADADALFAQLTEERRRRGLRPPSRLVRIWMDAMRAAEEVARGETESRALDELMEESASALVRQVSGWSVETSELAALEFPDEYLTAPRLSTAIGVAHRKDPNQAWGHYVVVMVSVTD